MRRSFSADMISSVVMDLSVRLFRHDAPVISNGFDGAGSGGNGGGGASYMRRISSIISSAVYFGGGACMVPETMSMTGGDDAAVFAFSSAFFLAAYAALSAMAASIRSCHRSKSVFSDIFVMIVCLYGDGVTGGSGRAVSFDGYGV
jgi:hypothetical protein